MFGNQREVAQGKREPIGSLTFKCLTNEIIESEHNRFFMLALGSISKFFEDESAKKGM